MPESADQRLAAAALEKRRLGQRVTREESAALRRVQKARDAELRAGHYRSVPKRDWQRWSGRQQKVLNEQAARYGIPIHRATINLEELAAWLHDFLARNHLKLNAPDDADPAIAGATSPGLERKRLADAARAELRYQQELGTWIPRRFVHTGFALLSSILRQAGERLQRECGLEAHAILDEALDDAQTAFHDHFAADAAERDDDPAHRSGP